jgi:hypothetical protein
MQSRFRSVAAPEPCSFTVTFTFPATLELTVIVEQFSYHTESTAHLAEGLPITLPLGAASSISNLLEEITYRDTVSISSDAKRFLRATCSK